MAGPNQIDPKYGDLKYWVALGRVPHLGTVRFRRLEAFFGTMEDVWRAGLGDLLAAGLEDKPAREVVAARNNVYPDDEMASLERAGAQAVTWNSPTYPVRLKEIPDPPPVIYYKGSLCPEDERSVAVVGTRNPTSYGKEAAAVLSRDLAHSGVTVVSGLARGIDGVAHRGALQAGGRTVAVVAGGLDNVYPREHGGLFSEIETQGAVISEQPLGIRPDARSFPRRNRLISGISLGTVVVEAAEGSGTRWTVYQALEQDREVFCVPGSIFSPASRFTNRMIQEGAKLVSNCNDILVELNLQSLNAGTASNSGPSSIPAAENQLSLESKAANVDNGTGAPGLDTRPPCADIDINSEESALLAHLGDSPVHIDEIGRQSGMPITTVNSTLTMLELKGMAKQVGCMHYVRMRETGVSYGN